MFDACKSSNIKGNYVDPKTIAELLFTAKHVPPDAETSARVAELIENDDSPDSGHSQFESASLVNVPLVQTYEKVMDNLGLGDVEVRPAVWFILFLLADGKHHRIILYLTVIHALNEPLVTARSFLRNFEHGVPTPEFLDNLFSLTQAPSGDCRLLNNKWRTA